MTIVLAVHKNDETVIAADTRLSFGNEIIPADNLRVEKILRAGSSYIGSSGWGLYDNILADFLRGRDEIKLDDGSSIFSFFLDFWQELHKRYPFVNDQSSDKDSPFGDLDAKFLIVNSAGIFLVGNNLSVRKFEKYYAIGSGSSYSLGALDTLYDRKLDAETIARRAVLTAIKFDKSCGGDVDLRRV
jgi:ATP-dependent HslUV protease, peptidase subunit HslV